MIVKVNRTVSDDDKLFFCLSSSFWTFVWARLKKSKFLFVCFLWVIFSFFLLFISDDLVFEKVEMKKFFQKTEQTSFRKVKRKKVRIIWNWNEQNSIMNFFYEIGKSLEDFHPVWWRWWCGYILNLKKYFHLNFWTTKNERMKNPGEKTR